MLRSWFGLFFLVLPLTLVASPMAADGPCAGCDKPPVKTAGFTIEVAQALYDAGTVPTKEELAGAWRRLGSISIVGLRTGSTNGYSPQGLLNLDLSLNTLEFTESTDLLGKVRQNVNLAHCGQKNLNQGPYAYELRPEGACFSQYLFAGSSISTDSYSGYRCRLTASKQLICSMTMHASDGSPDYVKKFDGQTVTYRLYAR